MKKSRNPAARLVHRTRAALRELREPTPAELSESLGAPFLEIPVNGDPTHWDWEKEQDVPYKWNPKWGPREITPENAPTAEQLLGFLKSTPGAYDRLIYCPEINNDHTDGWGMFGYSKGFVFINGLRYTEDVTISDIHFMDNLGVMETPSGRQVRTIGHYDFFPRHKFWTQEITQRTAPDTFTVLIQHYATPPSEQLALPASSQNALGSIVVGQIAQ